MPVEPPPSPWGFPDPAVADEAGVVGLGADLEPGTLLTAYRSGLFPMPAGRGARIAWWSPTGADHFWLPQGEPGTWDYTELSNNTDMGSGYKPVALDFDGDGHNDIVWLGDGSPHSRIFWGPG